MGTRGAETKNVLGALFFVAILLYLSAPAFAAPSGSFYPTDVKIGGTVTLSGTAKPDSAMSVYFYCYSDCGQTHLGVAKVNKQGRYALTFKVPTHAKPGGTYVRAGCDTCGNGWTKFDVLMVRYPVTGLFRPASAAVGDTITLSGQAMPGSLLNVSFHCDSNCGGINLGVIPVDGNGRYAATFKVPAQARPGQAYVKAGCDQCANGWSTFSGLMVKPTLRGVFSPSNATIGSTVTLSGDAVPYSSMSAYFYCENNCGQTHVGAARVDGSGKYALTFQVPPVANPGRTYVKAGCDRCGNGWNTFNGLTVNLPAAMRAVVFINYDFPLNLGHVGWGFELAPGTFMYGAKEATGTVLALPGQANSVFVEVGTEKEMIRAMRTGNHGGSRFPYHAYKYVTVRNPNRDAAKRLAYDSKNWGYALSGNNCMDDTFKIIKAYANGDDKILPWPSTHWTPKHFFADINTPLNRL